MGNKNKRDKPQRNTRSAGSLSEPMSKPNNSAKEPKAKQTNVTKKLATSRKEFQNEPTNLRNQLKEAQDMNAKEADNTLIELEQGNEELRTKCKERKKEVANLKTECENQKQEIQNLKKQYEDSLKALTTEIRKNLDEIIVLQQNVQSLKMEGEKLKGDLKVSEKNYLESLDSIKKNYEDKLENQKKEHESEISAFVSKDEYNSLYYEYDRIKRTLQETERKLERVIEAKKTVEKSKLEVIRQKKHQKDEMMEFVRNFNRQNKYHPQPTAQTYLPFKFCTHESKFGHYSNNEDFSKRFKRY